MQIAVRTKIATFANASGALLTPLLLSVLHPSPTPNTTLHHALPHTIAVNPTTNAAISNATRHLPNSRDHLATHPTNAAPPKHTPNTSTGGSPHRPL